MAEAQVGLTKVRTGIQGLDDITGGGLPRGRATLVCGQTGVGKTLLALEFLLHGAVSYDEPGVFLTFEETAGELHENVSSFGFDLNALIKQKKIVIDKICFDFNQATGAFDLDGLFIRLDQAIKMVNARRVVLDAADVLFMRLESPVLIREEIRRLLRWLKAREVSVIVTAESGVASLTRSGMEEYVSDCVILLENRVTLQSATRLLRIVKFRGSAHGTNAYPFLIGANGISVLPVTTLTLDILASQERLTTGIPRLDTMLDGKGYYRGSMIMVSGPPGSGKSSLAAIFAEASCARNERCQYFLLEESRSQIVRNMLSVGIDLKPLIDSNMLQFVMTRPTLHVLEMHLANFYQAITEFQPSAVIFDPVSTMHNIGERDELKAMLVRLVNFLKAKQITAIFVALTGQENLSSSNDTGILSMIDSWIELRNVESNGERNRLLTVLKSRGMPHSNQLREFVLNEHGIELADVYVSAAGIVTGSARVVRQAEEEAEKLALKQELAHRALELEQRRKLKDAQIAAIESEFATREADLERLNEIDRLRMLEAKNTGQKISISRQSDTVPDAGAVGQRDKLP